MSYRAERHWTFRPAPATPYARPRPDDDLYSQSIPPDPPTFDKMQTQELLTRVQDAERWRDQQKCRRRASRRRRRARNGKLLAERLLVQQAIDDQRSIQEVLNDLNGFASIVTAENVLVALAPRSPQAAQLAAMIPGCREMCSLVGMEDAKKQLFEVVMRGLLERLLPAGTLPRELQNLVVLGPPGVGKTTLLRAFATICRAGDITRRAHVSFVGRADMVGEYLGSSAKATTKVVKDALGGVLVIDEAYAFGSCDNRDPFAKEAIDCLTHLMDVHKDDLLVAVAGYADDVRNHFFAQNKGLARRFLVWLTLPAYTPDQLADIFDGNCKLRGWHVTPGARSKLVERAKELTHFASDVVSLGTHLELASSQRLWASATPLRMPDRAATIIGPPSGPPPLPSSIPSLHCNHPYNLREVSNGTPACQSEAKETYKFGSVDPQTLEMKITADDLESAMSRLLLGRNATQLVNMHHLDMYT